VPDDDFSSAILIVLGHGSTKNADSAVPVYQHAAELRRRRIFAEVREAFWKQEPQVRSVVAEAVAPRVFVVPLFISEGYFSDAIIPDALGFGPGRSVISTGSGRVHYCAPVGTHESMTGVLLARAREVVERHPFPRAPRQRDTSLFVAGHGTVQNENSRAAIELHAERIRALGEFASVQAVFMEEEPRIRACYELATAKNIVVVPFFISDGMHVREDIPILLGEPERVVRERLAAGQPTWRNPTGRNGKMVWYASAVGSEPGMADVILERVREAARALE
jgi:sirohydrochlorin cobaltochelatase